MDELNSFLSILIQGLLMIALPIVIAAAFIHIRTNWEQLKSKLNTEQLETLQKIGNMAVKAAEQAGLSGQLASGSEKREYAIKAAEQYLAKMGLKLDVGQIAALIESSVIEQFNTGGTPVADTAEARSQLLSQAVETAVLAAEQSGLKKLAGDVAASAVLSKKDYALEMAAKYLGEHGIKVDTSLIDGMIEAQIMRFKMDAAQKQAAAPAAAGGK